MSSERPITSSRLGRMAMLGKLAGGIAGNLVSQGAKQLGRGQRPQLSELILTPTNAQKLADRLSEMRGAAMKLGQLLSMDSGQLLSPQISDILSKLRDEAHHMPLGQVARVLDQAWGKEWPVRFERFSFQPLAAASIGQVHEAVLKDGRRLAVKIQYPGIGRSIDSDVNNVASLLRLFNALPRGLDLDPLLQEAKRQLHAEADYRLEAQAVKQFCRNLQGDDRFETLQVIDSLTTGEVLAMSHLDGHPIDRLSDAPKAERNRVAASLLELALREVFDWGLVQTDPNFSNYLYQPHSGKIQLLDFGATREYETGLREALRNLVFALVEGEVGDVERYAIQVGYLDESDPAGYRDLVIQLLQAATEPARTHGDYAFGQSDIANRMSEIVLSMRLEEKYTRIPPPGILFLHRKLGGLFLLLRHLRAEIPVQRLVLSQLQGKRRC